MFVALLGLSDADTIQLAIAAITALATGTALLNVWLAGRNEQRRTQPIVVAHEKGGRRFGPGAVGAEWVVDTYLTSEGDGPAFNVRFGVEFNGVRYPYRYSTADPETGSLQRVLRTGERRPEIGAWSIPFDSATMWGRAADSASSGDLDAERAYWARYENVQGQTWETRNPGRRSARLVVRRVRRPGRVEAREQPRRRAAAARDEKWLKAALDDLRAQAGSPEP